MNCLKKAVAGLLSLLIILSSIPITTVYADEIPSDSSVTDAPMEESVVDESPPIEDSDQDDSSHDEGSTSQEESSAQNEESSTIESSEESSSSESQQEESSQEESSLPEESSKQDEESSTVESSEESSSVSESQQEESSREESSLLEESSGQDESSKDESREESLESEGPVEETSEGTPLDLSEWLGTTGKMVNLMEGLTETEYQILLQMQELGIMPMANVNTDQVLTFSQAFIGGTTLFYGGKDPRQPENNPDDSHEYGDHDHDGNYFNDIWNSYDANGWQQYANGPMWAYSVLDADSAYRNWHLYNASVPYADWLTTSSSYGTFRNEQVGNHFMLRYVFAPGTRATLAYCIQMGNTIVDNSDFQTETVNTSDYIQNYLAPKNGGDQLRLFKLATHFAAQAESTAAPATSTPNYQWAKTWKILSPYGDEVKAYMESQGMQGNLLDWYVGSGAAIWEIVGGVKTIGNDGLTEFATGTSSAYRAALEGTPAALAYDWISAHIDDRLKIPSFTAATSGGISDAQTITLQWTPSENAYTAVVTDTNHAVAPDSTMRTGINLSALNGQGVTVTYLGNYQYKFSATSPVNITARDVSYQPSGSFGNQVSGMYVLEGEGNHQSAIVGAQISTENAGKYLRIETVTQQKVSIQKEIDSSEGYWDDLGTYSLAGAQYGIYTNATCSASSLVETLTTDANGYATSTKSYDVGATIYVKEIKAPTGYRLNTDVTRFTVTQTEVNNRIVVSDEPVDDPFNLSLRKYNSYTGETQTTGFTGTEFTLKYYDNYTWSGTPVWTGVFSTSANGTVNFSQSGLVSQSGSIQLRVEDGRIQLPLGSFTIEETKAPSGFILSDIVLQGTVTQPTSGGGTSPQLTQESLKELFNLGNDTYGFPEAPVTGTITGKKVSGQTNGGLAGATMGIWTNANCTGNPVQTVKTGADGSFSFTNLTYGTYYVKEVSTPNDDEYQLNTTIYRVVLNSASATVNSGSGIPNDELGDVKGFKQDPLGGPVVGAVMGLYSASGQELQRTTTNKDGWWYFDGLTYTASGTRYYVQEISAPSDYVVNTTQYAFTVSRTNPHIDLESAPIIDLFAPGRVEVQKRITGGVNDYASVSVAGFTFQLKGTDYRGIEHTYTATTGTNGVATFTGVEKGTYTLTETGSTNSNLDGFVFSSQNVTVNANQTSPVTFVNDVAVASLTLVKQDEDDANVKLAGATFDVYKRQSNGSYTKFGTMSDRGNGTYTISNLTVGSYYVVETEAPDHYLPDDTHHAFTVTKADDGRSITIASLASGNVFEESPEVGSLEIVKTAEQDEFKTTSLDGFQFRVQSVSQNAPASGSAYNQVLTTDAAGKIHIDGLRTGVYRITEIENDKTYGFKIVGSHEVTIQANSVESVKYDYVENELLRGSVQITKVDAEYPENKLTGATFTVYSEDGKVSMDMTEVETGVYRLDDLPFGDYYVQETKAPTYFVTDTAKYEFTIDQDGEVEIIATDGKDYLENLPQRGDLKIVKTLESYDIVTEASRPLEGIRFHVTGTALTGQTYDEYVKTGKNGEILIEDLRIGHYRIEEVPDETTYPYVTPAAQEIDVTADNTPDNPATVTFENLLRRGTVTLIKHGETRDERLAGAEFKLEIRDYLMDWEDQPTDLSGYLRDEDGRYYQWVEVADGVQTTNANGEAFFENLVVGRYRITETKAADGYQLLMDPVEFELPYTTEVVFDTALDQTFYIGDQPILYVPQAGGAGIWPFIIGGGAIVIAAAAAGFFLLKGKKKS